MFGSEAGTIVIVRKALYGLKSSGTAFRAHLGETLNDIGFLSTKAYPDIWYRLAVKPNTFGYYKYTLCYVDNILCISHDPGIVLGQIQAVLKLKDNKIEQHRIYIGDKVVKMIVYGAEGWYMSVEKYHIAAVENVE